MEFVAGVPSDLWAFAQGARRRAGFEFPNHSRVCRLPIGSPWGPTVGPGVMETRIRTAREPRGLYAAEHEDAVYVFHAFEKKARKASKREIELAKAWLAQVLTNRGSGALSRKDGP